MYLRSVLDEGIQEARLLLQDWLTILLNHYNDHITLPQRTESHKVSPSRNIDVMLLSDILTFKSIGNGKTDRYLLFQI